MGSVIVAIDVGGDHLPCLSSVSNSCRQPALQEQGVLKRTHGGAIAFVRLVEPELAEREVARREAKAAIGAA